MSQPNNSFKVATLSWDNSGSPYSEDYQDIFHSKANALAESSYIFLEANDLNKRWKNLNNKSFIIGECGFGAGLNFLNTCRLWRDSKTGDSTLYYIASELHPFSKNDLINFYSKHPQLADYSERLLQLYPSLHPGVHSIDLVFADKRIVLVLLFGDTKEMLSQIWQPNGFRVDAWYLDGFTPALNKEMWDDQLCSALAALSKTGTTLSTYSAAGLVKQSLRKNNFSIERKKGFADKRHMLIGKYEAGGEQSFVKSRIKTQAWFQLPQADFKAKSAIIIGAGLAGCSTASELAKTGWQVTLIERQHRIADKASGNPRGIVYCKLSNSADSSADYYLHSYFFALQRYQQIAEQHAIDWQPAGLLQIAYDEREHRRQSLAIKKLANADFLQILDAQEASEIAGISLDKSSLFFPSGAYLNPRTLCDVYTADSNIKCITDTEAISLCFDGEVWQVKNSQGQAYQAAIVIIANSYDALNFQQSSHYPLLQNFGQIDEYSNSKFSSALSCIVCAKAYVLPASSESQFVGGITKPHEIPIADRNKIAGENIELSKSISSQLAEDLKKEQRLASRSGLRCSSPDYLPLVGPVENKIRCQEIYKVLSRNARKQPSNEPIYEPGLFINVAHGSHGLSSTPIAASYLASLINKTPLPMSNANLNCLHPIRYLISNLKKQLL